MNEDKTKQEDKSKGSYLPSIRKHSKKGIDVFSESKSSLVTITCQYCDYYPADRKLVTEKSIPKNICGECYINDKYKLPIVENKCQINAELKDHYHVDGTHLQCPNGKICGGYTVEDYNKLKEQPETKIPVSFIETHECKRNHNSDEECCLMELYPKPQPKIKPEPGNPLYTEKEFIEALDTAVVQLDYTGLNFKKTEAVLEHIKQLILQAEHLVELSPTINLSNLTVEQVKLVIKNHCLECFHPESKHYENDIRAVIMCEVCTSDEENGPFCYRREF